MWQTPIPDEPPVLPARSASSPEGRPLGEQGWPWPSRTPGQQLRHDDSFAGLRDTLAAKGLPASAVILAGLVESEDCRRYGAMLTPDQECVLFETARDDSLILWEIIDDPRTLGYAFQAVLTGIAMVRAGQIS